MTVDDMAPLEKLSRDTKRVASRLDRRGAGHLVDMYYRFQEHRIAINNQVNSLDEAGQPVEVLSHFYTQTHQLEKQLVSVLGKWALGRKEGAWAQSVLGIGPVLSAALSAYIDITRAPTAGAIWRFCADEETEILTEDGWKRHHELNKNDIVLTFNKKTHYCEWQPVQAVNRYDGTHEMVSMETRDHSSLTTTNHSWFIRDNYSGQWKNVKSEDLLKRVHRAIPCAAPCVDVPVEAKYSDALVELVAWFITEGSPHINGGINISQSERVNPENVARIRVALDAYALGAWSEYDESNQALKWYLGTRASKEILAHVTCTKDGNYWSKVVSPSFIRNLTKAQLELFTSTAIAGDGNVHRGDSISIGQKKREPLEPIQMAYQLLGIRTHLYQRKWAGDWCLQTFKRSEFWPSNALRPNSTRRHRLTTYVGTVWCPTTPNGTWVARRNGTVYVTGNSGLDPTLIWVSKEKVGVMLTEVGGWPSDGGRLVKTPAEMDEDDEHAFEIEDPRVREVVVKLAAKLNRRPSTLVRMAINDDGLLTKDKILAAGARRPYNAKLKVVAWKIGDSFVKVSGREGAFYGHKYKDRKAVEQVKNMAGEFAHLAREALETRDIKDAALRATYESGKLPPGRIELRARRYAVKLFLAHWHEMAYKAHYDADPPLPYPIAILGHKDLIPVPMRSE
jgi:hypothetical protein